MNTCIFKLTKNGKLNWYVKGQENVFISQMTSIHFGRSSF